MIIFCRSLISVLEYLSLDSLVIEIRRLLRHLTRKVPWMGGGLPTQESIMAMMWRCKLGNFKTVDEKK